MTGFVGCRIVRAPVPIPVNDLAALVAATDEHRRIVLTFTDGQSTLALQFYVQRIDSLHRRPHLYLPGGCLLDVRPIVLLCLLDTSGLFKEGDYLHYARYHARMGRGTFIAQIDYERLRFYHAPDGVEPIVRVFNEQLLNEQPAHV